MVKVGDVVEFHVQGLKHNAIVLHLNTGLVDHLGANGEPMLHLAFIAPERESERAKKGFTYIPEVFTEYDVVHFSQSFSDEYRRLKGLTTPALLAQERGQGQWKLSAAPGAKKPPQAEAAPPPPSSPEPAPAADDKEDDKGEKKGPKK